MDSRTVLVVLAAALSLVCAALVVLTATARYSRVHHTRRVERLSGPQRRNILIVASGEDDDDSAARTLRSLSGPVWEATRLVVIGMLVKVRGAPAQALVDVVAAHGELSKARRQLHSRRPTVRARAVDLLGLARVEDAVEDLIPLTRDRSPEVRQAAVNSLGEIGSPSAAGAVLNAVLGPGSDPAVPSWLAAEALLSMGPGAEEVIRAGLSHSDDRVLGVALTVASHSVMPTTVPILRDRFARENDPRLRAEVATALGRVGGAQDVPLLVEATQAEYPQELRLACAAALGELGRPDGLARMAELCADQDLRVAQLSADHLLEAGPAGIRLLETAAREHSGLAPAAAALAVARLREGLPADGPGSSVATAQPVTATVVPVTGVGP